MLQANGSQTDTPPVRNGSLRSPADFLRAFAPARNHPPESQKPSPRIAIIIMIIITMSDNKIVRCIRLKSSAPPLLLCIRLTCPLLYPLFLDLHTHNQTHRSALGNRPPEIIGWSDNHFNNLHFGISLETNSIQTMQLNNT